MSVPTPTAEPTSIRAGDSVAWQRNLPEFDAGAGWVLAYKLTSTAATHQIPATGNGPAHAVALTKTATANFASGSYTLIGYVTNGTERVTIYAAPCAVLPDLVAATTYDGRSPAKAALDAARAAYYGRTGSGAIEYAVGDRSFKFETPADLLIRIRSLEQEVAREDAARAVAMGQAGGMPGRVTVRF